MSQSTIDRAVMCPMCHHEGALPISPMDGYAMRTCPACAGRWAVCTSKDLPDYDAEYRAAEHFLYRRYQEELGELKAGGEPPIYWFQRRQLARIRPFGKRRLLEVGCGIGMFLVAARRAGWEAFGLEASTGAARLAGELSGCEVLVGGLDDLPSRADPFEVISAFEVLEHVLDPLADLQRITAALSPGGYFTLSLPNDRSPHTRNPPDPEGRPPYHINFFQPGTVVACLRKAGLEPTWVYEKPFAWTETRRSVRTRALMLPWLVFAGYVLGRKGSRLVAWARKPTANSMDPAGKR
jgi:SAM-dependent methyltransferase